MDQCSISQTLIHGLAAALAKAGQYDRCGSVEIRNLLADQLAANEMHYFHSQAVLVLFDQPGVIAELQQLALLPTEHLQFKRLVQSLVNTLRCNEADATTVVRAAATAVKAARALPIVRGRPPLGRRWSRIAAGLAAGLLCCSVGLTHTPVQTPSGSPRGQAVGPSLGAYLGLLAVRSDSPRFVVLELQAQTGTVFHYRLSDSRAIQTGTCTFDASTGSLRLGVTGGLRWSGAQPSLLIGYDDIDATLRLTQRDL